MKVCLKLKKKEDNDTYKKMTRISWRRNNDSVEFWAVQGLRKGSLGDCDNGSRPFGKSFTLVWFPQGALGKCLGIKIFEYNNYSSSVFSCL